MASSLAKQWRLIDRLLQNMRFKRAAHCVPINSCLLDIGCGDGAFLHYMSGRIYEGIGIDVHIPDINTTCSKQSDLQLLRLSVDAALPFASDSFDVVTALAVVEHISNIGLFFPEVHRVLRKDGFFIFTTPSPKAKPILEVLAYGLRLISFEDIKDHKRYFSYETAAPLLSKFSSITYSTFQLGLNQLFFLVK
jgi:2-polyprenyl-3-methyl-5-hydroxy-6-metoxy-1,4-benzoquinol methylase